MSEVWQENQSYSDDNGSSTYQKHIQQATHKRQQNAGKDGCLAKFGCLKYLWATKWTEKNQTKEQLKNV